jgi:outer membrane protein TolC
MVLLACGCRDTHKDVSFLGEADRDHYRTHATAIEYPDVVTETPENVRDSLPPRTLDAKDRCEIRDIQLTEVVHIGMENSEIVRSGGQFLSAGNSLLTSPDRVASSYDSAIQESGVLFGGRGVEAALAEFDAQLNASLNFGRNDLPTNSLVLPATIGSHTGDFTASLAKTFANGGQATISHDVSYLRSNTPGTLFPSAYSGNLGINYQLPLLAGAGTEFTRIAGPITKSFGGISGVSQGVVIARINNDLVLCDYENALRNLTKDIEDAYWNLYLAYQLFDTATQVHHDTLKIWRVNQIRIDEGAGDRGSEAQSRDQLFQAKSLVDSARSNIYTREIELRRLLGLPVNDGTVMRPIEEPTTAQLIPDWHHSMSEALTQRVELRKQKWTIRSLDLQLHAARSLTRPRLDAVAGYQVNALGDNLASYGAGNSFYQGLSGANTDGWSAGVVMNMPVGLRSAHAQVRNYELRLAKAHKVLEVSEEEIAHEVAVAFQELSRTHAVLQSNHQRCLAASADVRILDVQEKEGHISTDLRLRGLIRRADAQRAYHESLIEYNKAITNLYYRKGTLLAYNNIQLAEGGWSGDAYQDAARLHGRRAHGNDIPVEAEPPVFVSPVPPGQVDFTTFPTESAESLPTASDQKPGTAEYNPPTEEQENAP